MNVVAVPDPEASLDAMWRALCAVGPRLENESEIRRVGNLAQWFDYAPYGNVLASENTGTTTAARQYIGQFSDADGLSDLNARYYNGAQGQFTSQDPVFLGTRSQQNLQDPQSSNSYSYSDDNPIVKSDPNGKFAPAAIAPFVFDTGAVLTVPEWAGPALIGAVGAGAAIGAYSLYEAYQPSAPGSYQASVQISGQGYDTEPTLPSRPPRGPYGMLAFTTVATAAGIYAFDTYAQPLLQPDNGLQPLRPQGGGSFGLLASPQATNSWSYSQLKLYTTPSGAVVNANGNLVSGPPSSAGEGGVQVSNGQTPVHNSNGTTSYCLGVCGRY
jgi:RHS repeat-associated protein